MPRSHLPSYAAAVTLLLALTGCSGAAPSASPTPTGSSATATPGPGGSPTRVTADTDLLAWEPVLGPVDDATTMAGDWTLTVSASGRTATIDGPTPVSVEAPRGTRISDALIDSAYALVVSQDRLEEQPSTATIVDLADGDTSKLDGDSSVPTTTGGIWALGGGRAYYATYGGPDGRSYCLAAEDLAQDSLRQVWCAPKRQGFSNARVGSDGTLSLLTFDNSQPACRTVVTLQAVDDAEPAPYDQAEACSGWEGVTLADSRVWTMIPKENRVEQARVYAAGPDGTLDLGEATSGTLLACGGAAFFSKDAGGGEPAQVLRWSPETGLDVVYEAAGATEGFITAPLRCGGDHLTLTALTSAGDEQVTAALG